MTARIYVCARGTRGAYTRRVCKQAAPLHTITYAVIRRRYTLAGYLFPFDKPLYTFLCLKYIYRNETRTSGRARLARFSPETHRREKSIKRDLNAKRGGCSNAFRRSISTARARDTSRSSPRLVLPATKRSVRKTARGSWRVKREKKKCAFHYRPLKLDRAVIA